MVHALENCGVANLNRQAHQHNCNRNRNVDEHHLLIAVFILDYLFLHTHNVRGCNNCDDLCVYYKCFHTEFIIEHQINLSGDNTHGTLCIEQNVNIRSQILRLEVCQPEAETEAAEKEAEEDDVCNILSVGESILVATVGLDCSGRVDRHGDHVVRLVVHHLHDQLLLHLIIKLEILRVEMPHAIDPCYLLQVFSRFYEPVL